MKAVKINMVEKSSSKSVKALIVGTIVNALIILVTTVILTVFSVAAGSLFENASKYLMLIPLVLGGYFGGFTSARINKSSGLLIGVLCGFMVLIITLIIGFSTGNADITYMLLLKALALLLPAAIGGVKGVNKKEKLKI